VVHTASLQRSQWHSPDRLRAAQERRLREIVAYAYAHSVHYRRQFAAAGIRPSDVATLDDLPRLPVLDRRGIDAHVAGLVADDAARYRPRRASTSGSSGSRLEFLRDRRTLSVGYAALWRFFGWHGISQAHRIAEFRIFRHASGAIDHTTVFHHAEGSRRLDLNQTNTSPDYRRQVADLLARFRPDVIKTASATWLAFLGEYLLDHPEPRIRPRVVVAGCERLFPEQRALIGEAFGAPVAEFYGNEEFTVFGGDCEHGRMHLAAEMGVVEILRDGRPAAIGDEGDVVVTSLWNRSFPFIRYAMGDVGALLADRCACGRGLPLWCVVGGSERDLLATPDGYVYLPTNVTGTPRWRGKVAGIRFYQETRREVVAHVVRGAGFGDGDEAALRDELERYLRGRLRVSIVYVDALEQTPGGKHRMVVSKVPRE
jgi:phenylacetate-CoA ligase